MEDSIKKLTEEVCAFRDARGWGEFHGPKDMAVAIAAESDARVETRRPEIASEMADVAILLFEMASNCGIDLTSAIRAKLACNEERYPVEKAKGSNKKYNEL